MFVLPSLITTAGLFCGVLALVNVFKQKYDQACWLILFAALLDVFDGMIARLTHTESDFGLNLDSLSDLVTFGVSPAALMLAFLREGNPKIVTPTCILYIICGALRLARYNVQAKGEESYAFSGLPIPAAAGSVISTYLFFSDNNLRTHIIPFLILALAILMVSTIPYPSLKSLRLKHRKPFFYLVVIAVGAVFVHWAFDSIELVLMAMFYAYVLWGATRYGLRRMRPRALAVQSAVKVVDVSQGRSAAGGMK
ncbi:MAG: CDP-diacylglycerol--serine O-phosphatidyltransferase [Candidatus Sumerlaeota bacterium]|nr:CDP-diacylglycerol--serine O-phosphatidyltransferase [Candidatus Sumerlaeota bacterium]